MTFRQFVEKALIMREHLFNLLARQQTAIDFDHGLVRHEIDLHTAMDDAHIAGARTQQWVLHLLHALVIFI